MQRVLGALLLLLGGTSGCYTVLRHPAVEHDAGPTFYAEAAYSLGPMQDCAACHEPWFASGFDPWLPPYPPLWVSYGTGPWWQRTGIEQAQGQALANERPRQPPAAAAPVALDMPRRDAGPVVKPAAAHRTAVAASRPHPAGSGSPAAGAPPAGGREATRAASPHAAPASTPAPAPRSQDAPTATAPQPAAPAPAAASAPSPAHGGSLSNSRPRPS